MKPAVPIHVPRLGVNEDEVLLAQWAVDNGARVEEGALLCTVETSKATSDVHADAAGWIHLRVQAGARVAVRAEIAVILPAADSTVPPPAVDNEPPDGPGPEASDQAAPGDDPPAPPGRRARSIAAALGLDDADASTGAADLLRRTRRADADPVAIYGAALGGRVIAEYLDAIGRHRAALFLDDSDDRPERFCSVPVRAGSDLARLADEEISRVFVAIGRGRIRLAVMARVDAAGLELLTIVHPTAFVAPSATVGAGALVKACAVVGTRSRVGRGAIIDNGAVVPHDNSVGAGALIAPGAALGSSITVGDRAVVGIGARVATAVRIGADAVVATGASVVRDVAAGDVVEGVPARVVGRVRLPTD